MPIQSLHNCLDLCLISANLKRAHKCGSRPTRRVAVLNLSAPDSLQRPAPQQGAPLFGAPRPERPRAPANPGRDRSDWTLVLAIMTAGLSVSCPVQCKVAIVAKHYVLPSVKRLVFGWVSTGVELTAETLCTSMMREAVSAAGRAPLWA